MLNYLVQSEVDICLQLEKQNGESFRVALHVADYAILKLDSIYECGQIPITNS